MTLVDKKLKAYFSELGRKGGKVVSEAKLKAARANAAIARKVLAESKSGALAGKS